VTLPDPSTRHQICFSGCLFLFWLVYADGMNAVGGVGVASCLTFYAPKLLLVAAYVTTSATIFLKHGRVPDRLNLSDAHALSETAQAPLVLALCASVVAVGAWLSCLVSRAVYRLGWKKVRDGAAAAASSSSAAAPPRRPPAPPPSQVEYIYTEREKSFVGITIVFVILSLCGHLYRAVHGRRGSWMQLQLPFLTLTNSYLALLTHAFWPSDDAATAPSDGRQLSRYDGVDGAGGYAGVGKGGASLLDDDDDDEL